MTNWGKLPKAAVESFQPYLGESPKPFNPESPKSIKRYNRLLEWERCLELKGIPKEDAYPTCFYAKQFDIEVIPPRFQTFSQLQSFRENMNHSRGLNRWPNPDPSNWILWIDQPKIEDLKYWTSQQRLELRIEWLSIVDENPDSIKYLTYDLREAYGLLTEEEYRNLSNSRMQLYERLFFNYDYSLFLPDADRNPATYRDPSYLIPNYRKWWRSTVNLRFD